MKYPFLLIFFCICLCLCSCEQSNESTEPLWQPIPIKTPNQLVELKPEIALLDSMIFQDCTVRHIAGFDTILENLSQGQRDQQFYFLNRLLLSSVLMEQEKDVMKWKEKIASLFPDPSKDKLQNIADWHFTHFVEALANGEDWEIPLQKSLDLYEGIFGKENIRMAHILHFAAYRIYWHTANVQLSIKLFEDESKILKLNHVLDLRHSRNQYYTAGNYYYDLDDFHSAIQYLENSKADYTANKLVVNSLPYYSILNLLAACYSQIEDSIRARENFESSIALLEQMPDQRILLLKAITSYSTALTYINGYEFIEPLAHRFFELCRADEFLLLADYEKSLGYVFSSGEIKDYAKAEMYFKRALSNYEKVEDKSDLSGSWYIDALYGLAELNIYHGDLNEGRLLLEKACLAWSGRSLDEVLFHVPLSKIQHLEDANYFLESGAQIYRMQWEANPAVESNFQKAYLIYQRLDALYTLMNQTLFKENLFVDLELEFRAYSKAIDLLNSRFERHPHDTLIDHALYFMEKAKYGMLLSKVSMDDIAEKYQIPDHVLNIAEQLYEQERNYFSGDSELNANLPTTLIEERRSLHNIIRSSHPEFYTAIFDPPRIDLKGLRFFTQSKQALAIQYHMYKENVYCLAVNSDHSQFIQIPFDSSLQDSVKKFIKLVSSYPEHEVRTAKSSSEFEALGLKLYKHLVEPVEEMFSEEQHIYICADGLLEHLPFDALVQTSGTHGSLPYDLGYFGNSQEIQYGFSLSTLTRHVAESDDLSELHLSVFSYSGKKRDDSSKKHQITGSYDELKSIEKTWDKKKTNTYPGKKATQYQFYKALDSGGIIHLATHATQDTIDRFGGLLYFRGEDEVLVLSDLFSKRIEVPLVVLSACETGTGVQYSGEGTFSIARPFILAGAKRVIQSHWKIHDKSTAKIMGTFYTSLSDGISPSAISF